MRCFESRHRRNNERMLDNLRLRFATRASLIRLGILMGLACAGFYWMTSMPGTTFSGPLSPLTETEGKLSNELRRHIVTLSQEIGARSVQASAGLDAARRYVETSLEGFDYVVKSQEFEVAGVVCANVEVELPGLSRPSEIVIVGGHYDGYRMQPAANDNATGTAAVLELARLLRGHQPARTLRFVAFVNEEPPYFKTNNMGSRVYAKRCSERGEDVVAMLSLETLGYYNDVEGSQEYPAVIGWLYPSRGNFVGFVGNLSSRGLVRRAVSTFRSNAHFPSEGAALPAFITGVDWSDHASFWKEGFPAAMVTDTAVFRYPHYHTHSDTPDKIDFNRLARVVAGLVHVLADLSQ